jgi:hypothetical protein
MPLEIPLSIVLEPVHSGVFAGVGTHEIDMTVAVNVSRADTVTVLEIVRNQVL